MARRAQRRTNKGMKGRRGSPEVEMWCFGAARTGQLHTTKFFALDRIRYCRLKSNYY